MTRDSRGPFASPFDDSRAPSRAGSDDDLNTQTVSEKFNILPSAGLLLFPEDVEKDDYLHNPDPNEKEKRDCDIFTRRGVVNVGGLAILALGILFLFIGYPILYVLSHHWHCARTWLTRIQHLRRQNDKTRDRAVHKQPLVHQGQRKRAPSAKPPKRFNRPGHTRERHDTDVIRGKEAEARFLRRVQHRRTHIL